ncbi:MAG: hypothetical protein H3Z50_07115 [archaeon]|nr:hypothetical protein [archaeon]
MKSENKEIKEEMSKAGVAMALFEALIDPEVVPDERFEELKNIYIELSVLRKFEDARLRMKHLVNIKSKPILKAVLDNVNRYIERLLEDRSETRGRFLHEADKKRTY